MLGRSCPARSEARTRVKTKTRVSGNFIGATGGLCRNRTFAWRENAINRPRFEAQWRRGHSFLAWCLKCYWAEFPTNSPRVSLPSPSLSKFLKRASRSAWPLSPVWNSSRLRMASLDVSQRVKALARISGGTLDPAAPENGRRGFAGMACLLRHSGFGAVGSVAFQSRASLVRRVTISG